MGVTCELGRLLPRCPTRAVPADHPPVLEVTALGPSLDRWPRRVPATSNLAER